MKTAIICIIGLVGSWAVGPRVRLFDRADLGSSLRTTTDESGYFALPLTALPRSMVLLDGAVGSGGGAGSGGAADPWNGVAPLHGVSKARWSPQAGRREWDPLPGGGLGYRRGSGLRADGLGSGAGPLGRPGFPNGRRAGRDPGPAAVLPASREGASGGLLGDVNREGQVDLADARPIETYPGDPSDVSLPEGIGAPEGAEKCWLTTLREIPTLSEPRIARSPRPLPR